ncbi:MAG: hypothetical protein KDD38_10190 [Bdellovibrionales bacterium]|nr:hypothetical protein [Bdellovibrionales bacterium]
MNIDFSPASLLSGFIFGVFGIYVFREGKRRQSFSLYFIGVALMGYTYLTPNVYWDWGIGSALLYLAYRIRFL